MKQEHGLRFGHSSAHSLQCLLLLKGGESHSGCGRRLKLESDHRGLGWAYERVREVGGQHRQSPARGSGLVGGQWSQSWQWRCNFASIERENNCYCY